MTPGIVLVEYIDMLSIEVISGKPVYVSEGLEAIFPV